MAEDQKNKAPWKESIWVQSSRKPENTDFDARLEEAIEKAKTAEVEEKKS